MVDVKKGEFIVFNEYFCEWKWETEGGRRRGGVSYGLLKWTLYVLTPA